VGFAPPPPPAQAVLFSLSLPLASADFSSFSRFRIRARLVVGPMLACWSISFPFLSLLSRFDCIHRCLQLRTRRRRAHGIEIQDGHQQKWLGSAWQQRRRSVAGGLHYISDESDGTTAIGRSRSCHFFPHFFPFVLSQVVRLSDGGCLVAQVSRSGNYLRHIDSGVAGTRIRDGLQRDVGLPRRRRKPWIGSKGYGIRHLPYSCAV
jgi:hypothetical protein